MVPSVVFLQSTLCSKTSFWVIPFTCCGSQCCLAPKCFLLKMNILGGSLHFLWFPILFGSNIFSIQNQHFWVVPFTLYGSQCCLAPMCFLLKTNIFSLFMVLCVVSFPVLFGSSMFSTQNQHFGWFASLFMVPSVVWLQIALCSPCWTVRSCLDNIGVGTGILNYLKCLLFIHLFKSDSET